jgi:CRISPR system Cascade subunit CasD
MMPTKSGVIGMVAAALGLNRQASLEQFENLRFGVRADQPGKLMSDYQTAQKYYDDAAKKTITLPVSVRYYVQDAVFLVGLESPDTDLLQRYQQALAAPHYQIFLGRRSCPPDGPLQTSIVDLELEEALKGAPWEASKNYQRYSRYTAAWYPERSTAEIAVEPRDGEAINGYPDELNDEPVSFDPRERKWRSRKVVRLQEVVQFGDKNISDSEDSENHAPVEGAMRLDPTAFDGDAIFGAVSQADEEES